MAALNPPVLTRTAPSLVRDWSIESNSFVHTSPYTRQVDTIEKVGACWSFIEEYRNLGFVDRAIFLAWLAKVNGIAGRFYRSHPLYATPRGTARGTGVASNAAQFATAVTLAGAGIPNGATLLEGDFVEVGNVPTETPMLLIVADAAVAAAGSITINVRPMLRRAITGGATPFSLVSPRAQFRLVDDKQGLSISPGPMFGFGDYTLAAMEAY